MSDWSDELIIGGHHRSYRCHLPGDDAAPDALVIALHGRNLSVDEMRLVTHLDAIADRYDVLVTYPEGHRRSWNDGRGNTPAERDDVDDVRFIQCLIDRLIDQYGIDPACVGATGLSNGAVMCHRLGLELGDRISVIAPVAGTMPVALAHVTPPYAVSVLQVHGTRDRVTPIAGGRAHGLGRVLLALRGVRAPAGPILSLKETADRWRAIDRCADRGTGESLAASALDPTSVERVTWVGGQGGTEVESWTVEGGGHTWPGGPPRFGLGLLGRTSSQFDAGDVIVRFMAQHWHSAVSRALHEGREG